MKMRAAGFLRLMAMAGLALSAAPALAYCPSIPDGPESENVRNGVDRAICLQQELAAETRQMQQLKDFEIMLENLQRDQFAQQRRTWPGAPVF